jgi:hypothetical protein
MSELKRRHGCLTAWLVLMIFTNSLTAVVYSLAGAFLRRFTPGAPRWAFPVLAAVGIVNTVCAFALFRWKKWGFYGFVATALVTAVVNVVIGLKIVQILLGLAGVAILYGVLQIGSEKKGWTQLE